MYKLELTMWERIQLDITLPRNAPLSQIPQLLRIMDTIKLDASEKSSISYEIVDIETQRGTIQSMQYDHEKITKAEHNKDVHIETEDFIVLKKCVMDRPNWPTEERSMILLDKIESAEEVVPDKQKK